MIDKIGIQTFTIRNDINTISKLDEAFRYYVNLGIKNFELARINFNQQEMAKLKELKCELGLKYTACQLTYKKIVKNFDFMVNFCRQLDIKYLEVSVIPISDFMKGKQGIITLSKKLNELGKKAKNNNVNLLYHHHNFELIKHDGKISLDNLIDNTDEKSVNFVCDTYWLAKSGYDPAKFIEKRIGRVKGVHLRDNILKYRLGKFISTDAAIGHGTIDFASIAALDKYSKIDFYSIEQNTQHPKRDISKSYEYIKDIITRT